MDNPQFWLESIKGIWAVVAVVTTAVCSWIGFLIKERVSKKKEEQKYREDQANKQAALEAKVDNMIEILTEFSKEQNKKLCRLSTGLELCLENDEIIFSAFRKTKILNGESEAQSKKLEAFRQGLLHDSLMVDSSLDELNKNSPI